MHFGFALDVFKTSWKTKNCYAEDVLKTSSRHVFKTSSRHVFKTSSRHVFKTSSRRLQRNNFSSSKKSSWRLQDVFETSCEMSSRRLQDIFARRLQDVFKTSWRCLGKRKTVTLKTWCLEDVLKTNKCLLGLFLLRDKEEVICKNVLVL